MAQADRFAQMAPSALALRTELLLKEIKMHANGTVPQPAPGTPGTPGTYTPIEVPTPVVPPEPAPPPEIDPTPTEPTIPVREPGTISPPQAV